MDMDFREPSRPQAHPEEVAEPHHVPQKKKSGKGKKLLLWLLVLILIAGAAAAGWYYRDLQAKDDEKVSFAIIAELQAKNRSLEKELTAAKAAAAAATSTPKQPSQEELDNIEAAVKSGNYAALEQLMASKVTVIIVASEGIGARTPTQAVSDLKYIDNGTDPWSCGTKTEAILGGFPQENYEQWFPHEQQEGLVCKSANGYVVSFIFDENGKIKNITMAAPGVDLT